MDEKKGSKLGIILILIGAFFIVTRFDWFNINFNLYNMMQGVVRFWPLFLIAVGLSIIFSSKSIVKAIIWIVFFGFIVYIFVAVGGFSDYNFHMKNGKFEVNEKHYKVEKIMEIEDPLEAKAGKLIIDMGACALNIGDLDTGLVDVETTIEKASAIRSVSGSDVEIQVSEIGQFNTSLSSQRRMNINISDDIPWEIEASTGVVDGYFDLKDIEVSDFDLTIGAGTADIYFGDKTEVITALIEGGVSSITIYVPEDTGIRIEEESGLSSLEYAMDMTEKGSRLYSDNYDTADEKINILLQVGVSDVEVKYYK